MGLATHSYANMYMHQLSTPSFDNSVLELELLVHEFDQWDDLVEMIQVQAKLCFLCEGADNFNFCISRSNYFIIYLISRSWDKRLITCLQAMKLRFHCSFGICFLIHSGCKSVVNRAAGYSWFSFTIDLSVTVDIERPQWRKMQKSIITTDFNRSPYI